MKNRVVFIVFILLFSQLAFSHNQLTITGVHPEHYVNAYVFNGGSTAIFLYTVPEGKTFVLTDILSGGTGVIIAAGNPKLYVSTQAITLSSGVNYPSGTDLLWDPSGTGVAISITGYLYDPSVP